MQKPPLAPRCLTRPPALLGRGLSPLPSRVLTFSSRQPFIMPVVGFLPPCAALSLAWQRYTYPSRHPRPRYTNRSLPLFYARVAPHPVALMPVCLPAARLPAPAAELPIAQAGALAPFGLPCLSAAFASARSPDPPLNDSLFPAMPIPALLNRLWPPRTDSGALPLYTFSARHCPSAIYLFPCKHSTYKRIRMLQGKAGRVFSRQKLLECSATRGCRLLGLCCWGASCRQWCVLLQCQPVHCWLYCRWSCAGALEWGHPSPWQSCRRPRYWPYVLTLATALTPP